MRTGWYMYLIDRHIYQLHLVPRRCKGQPSLFFEFPVIRQLGRDHTYALGAVLIEFKKYWRSLTRIEKALYDLK